MTPPEEKPKAPQRPPNAAELAAQFQREHAFAAPTDAPDFQKIADEAAARYEKLHAATSAPLPAPKAGELAPEMEQIWAELRKLRASGGGGGGSFSPPFEISNPDTANIIVKAGAVNEVAATGTGSNIDLSGESDDTYSIYIDATIDTDGEVTAAEVNYASSLPSDTHDHAYRLLGTATVAGGAITAFSQLRYFSQEFIACGRDPEDSETTPGTYRWGVGG